MDLFELSDEEKVKQAYSILRSINDWVVKCFTVAWNLPPDRISMGDRIMVEKMINEYGQEVVRDAFLEARVQKKETLAYVRSVAKSINEQRSIKTNIEHHQKIKSEDKQEYYNSEKDEKLTDILNKLVKEKAI